MEIDKNSISYQLIEDIVSAYYIDIALSWEDPHSPTLLQQTWHIQVWG
jgi:hypothetical protein